MEPLVVAACVLVPCAAAATWLLLRGRRAPSRPRRRSRPQTPPLAPKGSDDGERAAWTLAKLAGVPPKKAADGRTVEALLGAAARKRLTEALEREFGVRPPEIDALLGLDAARLGRLMRQLKRGKKARPAGRRRITTAGDAFAGLTPPLLALASELGLRAEWELPKAREHLTKEYLRQNARIHLAAKAEDRDAVQARLEEIGRLRRALAAGR